MTPLRTAALALTALAFTLTLCADDKDKDKDKKAGVMALTDTNDKEHKVTEWKWLTGTKHLGWLAPDADEPDAKDKKAKDKGKKAKAEPTGPEAFVFREVDKINYQAGVQTLIPVERLRSLRFDADKSILTLEAMGDKDEVRLEGTTKYTGINWFSLEADVDRGDAGIASFKYQGGSKKGNVKSIRFPANKVEPIKGGRPAVVQTLDKTIKQTHKVTDLTPLYLVAGGREKNSPILAFRKTLRLDVSKIKSITDASEDGEEVAWKVVQKDGEETPLTLIERTTINEQQAQLQGFVAKVPVGYKFFPLRRIASILFDVSEPPKENQLPDPVVEKDGDQKDD